MCVYIDLWVYICMFIYFVCTFMSTGTHMERWGAGVETHFQEIE